MPKKRDDVKVFILAEHRGQMVSTKGIIRAYWFERKGSYRSVSRQTVLAAIHELIDEGYARPSKGGGRNSGWIIFETRDSKSEWR